MLRLNFLGSVTNGCGFLARHSSELPVVWMVFLSVEAIRRRNTAKAWILTKGVATAEVTEEERRVNCRNKSDGRIDVVCCCVLHI